MGSPLGPLMANTFMCSIEGNLVDNHHMPSFYRHFIDNTITIQRNLTAARDFLDALNNCHQSLNFTMESEIDGRLPFLGMEAIRNHEHIETKVYIKPTNTGRRYNRSLIVSMLNPLSSSCKYFVEECERLKGVFFNLRYPHGSLIQSSLTFSRRNTKNEQFNSNRIYERECYSRISSF